MICFFNLITLLSNRAIVVAPIFSFEKSFVNNPNNEEESVEL